MQLADKAWTFALSFHSDKLFSLNKTQKLSETLTQKSAEVVFGLLQIASSIPSNCASQVTRHTNSSQVFSALWPMFIQEPTSRSASRNSSQVTDPLALRTVGVGSWKGGIGRRKAEEDPQQVESLENHRLLATLFASECAKHCCTLTLPANHESNHSTLSA